MAKSVTISEPMAAPAAVPISFDRLKPRSLHGHEAAASTLRRTAAQPLREPLAVLVDAPSLDSSSSWAFRDVERFSSRTSRSACHGYAERRGRANGTRQK
jgi:hypothetical protein